MKRRLMVLATALVLGGCGPSSMTGSQWAWCVGHLDEADRAAARLGYEFQPSIVFAVAALAYAEDGSDLAPVMMKNPDYAKICLEAMK